MDDYSSMRLTADLLLRHPLLVAALQLLAAIVLAYVGTERWQRWRQRRDFQYRTMSKFSEITADLHSRLQELYALRLTDSTTDFQARFREFNARRPQLAALEGELVGSFGDDEIHHQYADLLVATRIFLRTIRSERAPRNEFDAAEDRFLAIRRLVIGRMNATMGFLPKKVLRREVEDVKPRTALPEEPARYDPGRGNEMSEREESAPTPSVSDNVKVDEAWAVSGSRTWQQQHARMMRAYARATSATAAGLQVEDDYYNFFAFSFHLKDWIKNDPSVSVAARAAAETLVKTAPSLQVCADLANGIKHLSATRHPRVDPDSKLAAMHTRAGTRIVVVAAGQTEDARQVADTCVREWDNFLNAQGLM